MPAARSKIPLWYLDQIPGHAPSPADTQGLRKRVRRRDLAEAFGVNVRTIDYWWKVTKFLPAPHYLEVN
jgi:hypothetical protein